MYEANNSGNEGKALKSDRVLDSTRIDSKFNPTRGWLPVDYIPSAKRGDLGFYDEQG